MNNHDLENLYRSTEEHVHFTIGVVALPRLEPVPILQIHCGDWLREKLIKIGAKVVWHAKYVTSHMAKWRCHFRCSRQSWNVSSDSAYGHRCRLKRVVRPGMMPV